MKRFIKKIIGFSILSLMVVIFVAISTHFTIKSQGSFEIDNNIDKIILGHSHSECSVNDSIVKNSINLSSSGESYFFNYQKLNKIIEDNSHINTVFIEFTNNHVDSLMDDWIWGYEKMAYYMQFYAPFMKTKDFELLFKNNSTDLLASYSIATRKHLYRIIQGDFEFIDEVGGYLYTEESKVDEMIANDFFDRTISNGESISETNLKYLRKIIDLCNDNSMNVYLFRSPQHPLHPDLSNENQYQKILKERFSDVELLDFDEMYFPNKHYLDLHHLNNLGSEQFSTLFNELIEKGLLKSINKQALINKHIQKFNLENKAAFSKTNLPGRYHQNQDLE